ncbi:hypothetical protein G7Y89_g1668 [Cudoniella acicularis]|uniref:Alpha/beta hydrolase fold-3 domain-containing protein n=1 Tax=Cudoniella acicularis TaxID=354080 RepID=A0A8H4RUU5_9HELO|nr:hypothetical protein G7Y89_g1668 [Cudoniella acicularis]
MPLQEETPASRKLLHLTQTFSKTKAHIFYAPVSLQQAVTATDRPANGPVWASRTTFPAPKNDAILTAVTEAIADLGDGSESSNETPASSVEDVQFQWSGYRTGVEKGEKEPDVSEREKYEGLMRDTRSKTTILYVHGGFYYTGGPASVRAVTSTLAKISKGRCLVLDQRLCPQNPFPAALIDFLVAYLSLLYPPLDSFHEAVPPQEIVLAGDSSGGNMCLAFLLLIQYLRQKQNSKIKFHDAYVSIPYPAGVATFGAHTDATMSLPSFHSNSKWDFLVDTLPFLSDAFPSCPLWPTSPPRSSIYTTTPLLIHPLYNALPHIFAFLFPSLPQSVHMLSQWAEFCRVCVEEPEKLARNNNRYKIYEPREGENEDGFHCVEKRVNEKGDEFWEGVDLENVVQKMKEKQGQMKIWVGPTRKDSVL